MGALSTGEEVDLRIQTNFGLFLGHDRFGHLFFRLFNPPPQKFKSFYQILPPLQSWGISSVRSRSPSFIHERRMHPYPETDGMLTILGGRGLFDFHL